MEENKDQEILLKAAELFSKYGIKSMTMDDIARNMGISKKTLYQYVANKKDLVKKCIQTHIDSEECLVKDCMGESDNAIDEMMKMTEIVGTQMKEMHPSIIYDLKKYHFEAYTRLTSHRDDFIYNKTKNNLIRGIEEGLYRKSVNVDIISKLYIAMADLIIDPQTRDLDGFTNADIHREIVHYHLKGIVSERGSQYIKEKFNQENLQ